LLVWQILGGKYREHVRIYADCHAGDALESITPLLVPRGFGVLKFDLDVPTPYETEEYNRDLSHLEIEHMASLVAATREAVGMGVGLAIDYHWNYGVQAAIDLARGEDWSGQWAIFFRILLTDDAAWHRLRDVATKVVWELARQLDFPGIGVFPYHNVRSVSAQSMLQEPAWA